MAFTASDICKVLTFPVLASSIYTDGPAFAIVLPPLGVFLERGCTADLVSRPGIIHALYIILKY
ncbi:plasma membrane proteolipid 3 [Suillus occidentalis]|nr:plasma membrane proteolipid 3 [Suillus occidentalis]